jgi:hypothetical protein
VIELCTQSSHLLALSVILIGARESAHAELEGSGQTEGQGAPGRGGGRRQTTVRAD